jgi:hypothetical protein
VNAIREAYTWTQTGSMLFGRSVNDFFGDGSEDVTWFVALVQDQQHAGKTVGDQQLFFGIAVGGFAGFPRFDEFERTAAIVGEKLIFEDGFFAVDGFAIFTDEGLSDVLVADYVGNLFEESVD